MKFRLLPVAATAMLALSACTGGRGSSGPSPAPGGPPAALVEAAKCMRANGLPQWPDPVRRPDGRWGWPDDAPEVTAPPACEELMRQGKSGQQPSRRPLSAADMTLLRKWADCVRAHGIADWPDPDADGQFDPPARLRPLASNQELAAVSRACEALEPPGGIGMKPDAEKSRAAD
jgi:hypothetical protein